jgi:hypothetical protein
MRFPFAGGIAFSLLGVGSVVGTLCGCGGYRVSYDGPMTVNASQDPKDPAEVVSITFRLLRKPSIEKTRGHPHSPFGVSGHNRYWYEGGLAFAGKEAGLTSQFHPISLYKSGGKYFLLGQYWFNPELFQWHTLESGAFQEVDLDIIPPALLSVHPVDTRVSAFFRLWTVTQLLEKAGPDAAARRFSEYVGENHHFPYEQNQGPWPNTIQGEWRSAGAYDLPTCRYTTLPDLLTKVASRKADGFYAPLVSVLNSAKPADDPQDVGLVALTLTELRQREGTDAVQDFIRKVGAEGGQGDPRLSDLEWRLKASAELRAKSAASAGHAPETGASR